MFADVARLPLNSNFYKDGCMYTVCEGGLTAGDADTFAKVPQHVVQYPIIQGESLGSWAARYGAPLYQAIREYKVECHLAKELL